jgi:hypothetical protein
VLRASWRIQLESLPHQSGKPSESPFIILD